MTVQTIIESKKAEEAIPEVLWDKIETPPFVLIQGEHDVANTAFTNYTLFNQIRTKDKELWYYEEMRIMFLLEEQHSDIENRLIGWLERQCSKHLSKN